ncbi:GNAT family N-acetyltransferase [Microbacterium gorillae]|uniref:GNAT family N-acetyltransferase n=1 Tax=Microbacterium gorillae TaxID=1231063 RepID=UPI00059176C3|nr:GNAT family N-acetyltransferase [Microbacterium gorillae]
MDPERYRTSPLDPTAVAELAAAGFELQLAEDPAATEAWYQAVRRGFHGGEYTAEHKAVRGARVGYRRRTIVRDPLAEAPGEVVGTFATWASELTVPGELVVDACAVSSVTVAPTHRRRGILRSLMSGALREAVAAGFPVAMLTVTESTIYPRFGFGAAAEAASWTIDTRRVRWTGPTTSGRLDFISRERLGEVAPILHERVRRRTPGEAQGPSGHWLHLPRTEADAEKATELRVVQHRDDAGEVQGLVAYTVAGAADETQHKVTVEFLATATDDAYAALWRFLLELDLVATVTAHELAADESLRWMLGDQRAATVTVLDHQYVRILDVVAALEARTYPAAGELVLSVADPLGFATGEYTLRVDASGIGRVEVGYTAPDAPRLTLGVTELGSLYLGGVRARTLAAAGRLEATDLDAVDDLFRSRVTPRLSFWY